MKRLVFAVALIVAALFDHVAYADADADLSFECFSSPEAVHEAHHGSHAVYSAHVTGWPETSKCWHVHQAVAKPKAKPRFAAIAGPAPSHYVAQALPLQPRQEVKATYEEAAAALRAMMFGPDESPTGFEARFSAIAYMPTF